MGKSITVVETEISTIEKRIEYLREAYDETKHPHDQVVIQMAIDTAVSELKTYQNLLDQLKGGKK